MRTQPGRKCRAAGSRGGALGTQRFLPHAGIEGQREEVRVKAALSDRVLQRIGRRTAMMLVSLARMRRMAWFGFHERKAG